MPMDLQQSNNLFEFHYNKHIPYRYKYFLNFFSYKNYARFLLNHHILPHAKIKANPSGSTRQHQTETVMEERFVDAD